MNPFRPTGTHSGAAPQDRKVTKYPQAGGENGENSASQAKKPACPPKNTYLYG